MLISKADVCVLFPASQMWQSDCFSFPVNWKSLVFILQTNKMLFCPLTFNWSIYWDNNNKLQLYFRAQSVVWTHMTTQHGQIQKWKLYRSSYLTLCKKASIHYLHHLSPRGHRELEPIPADSGREAWYKERSLLGYFWVQGQKSWPHAGVRLWTSVSNICTHLRTNHQPTLSPNNTTLEKLHSEHHSSSSNYKT